MASDSDILEWISQFPDIIRPCADTQERKLKAEVAIYMAGSIREQSQGHAHN